MTTRTYDGPMSRPAELLARLRADADSGALAELCAGVGIEMLVVFGSVLTRPESAGDVDLAYRPGAGALDRLSIITQLQDRYGDGLDVMLLNRAGAVASYAALGAGELLVEAVPGTFAEQQMRAFGLYRDTQKMRDLQLEVLLG